VSWTGRKPELVGIVEVLVVVVVTGAAMKVTVTSNGVIVLVIVE